MPTPNHKDRLPTPEEDAYRASFNTPIEAMNLTPEEAERRTIEECDRIRKKHGLPPFDPSQLDPSEAEEGSDTP